MVLCKCGHLAENHKYYDKIVKDCGMCECKQFDDRYPKIVDLGRTMVGNEISLCKWCHCMTKTVRKEALSGSENKKYRYQCGKCGFKKELLIVKGCLTK